MSHWIILPILLPAITAPLLALAVRHDIVLARTFSLASSLLMLMLALFLLSQASDGTILKYHLGNWPAPFGIVLALDRLSAMMLLLNALLGLLVLLYAMGGWDKRGLHFHPMFQFLLMGINGAFLTGDLFNLFVFFEVLLIASYGLMVHGGGALRLRSGVQYVVINLIGSSIFLIAVGLIYSVTGTLNMADLALKVAAVQPGDQALLHTGALLLLLVFCIKAALVPVQFWLPATYANAPAPIAALFAIMTKVGAYAIIRVYTLIFGASAGAESWIAGSWLVPAALVTLALGAMGVLAARSLGQLVSFAVIMSMGTLLTAVGLFTPQSMSAALYYLLHSTLAAGAMFLVVDLVVQRRAQHGDLLQPAPSFAQISLIGGCFFVAAIAMTGMPPLSGFIAKLQILNSVRHADAAVWIWALLLTGSLLSILGFARAGSLLFWKSTAVNGELKPGRRSGTLPLVALGLVFGSLLLLTIFAGPVNHYLEQTAAQLFAPQGYIDAVLATEGVR
ncbi:MAG: monovalent cation/H+ antiporter subunit D [Gammaproteobacteria bacterium]|nr:monovalent cation/H+ antiporter subunit D [Gammaproteobacteria bacterium]